MRTNFYGPFKFNLAGVIYTAVVETNNNNPYYANPVQSKLAKFRLMHRKSQVENFKAHYK